MDYNTMILKSPCIHSDTQIKKKKSEVTRKKGKLQKNKNKNGS